MTRSWFRPVIPPTRIADGALRERGDLDGRARRKVVDMVAASVILQDWLDHHRPEDAS